MHLLFQNKSSGNSTLRRLSVWKVLWSSFTSFNPTSQMRRHSVRKQTRVFETISLMLVLPQWSSAASVKALRGTHQHYTCPKLILEENDARVRIAKRRASLGIWLGWIAALLNLDTAYDDKVCMLRSSGRFLLTENHRAPQCEHNDFKTVNRKSCP